MSRTYVITGAGSGIGKTTAEILRNRGDKVIGVDLKDAEVIADLSTNSGRLEAAAEASRLADGAVDAVIACAGIAAPVALTSKVNYFGVTEFLEAMIPALEKSDAPRAAVVSSMASLQPVSAELVDAMLAGDEAQAEKIGQALADQGPEVGYLNYSSSKRAISRWIRREAPGANWAGKSIPLNAAAPGVVLTPMTEKLLETEESRAMVDASTPMPLNYHQGPETIANLLIWLTSVENSHCCGQTIYCDGGTDTMLRGDDIWSWNDAAMAAKLQGGA